MKTLFTICMAMLWFNSFSQKMIVKLTQDATYFTDINKAPILFDKHQDSITVIKKLDSDFWIANLNNETIYVKSFNFEESGEYKKYLDQIALNNKKHKQQLYIQNKEFLSKKYGKEISELIVSRRVKLGWTKDLAILSWGKPKKKHDTVVTGRVEEQWVYDGGYLYFTNGILTGIQN
jgi:hypothetical protein